MDSSTLGPPALSTLDPTLPMASAGAAISSTPVAIGSVPLYPAPSLALLSLLCGAIAPIDIVATFWNVRRALFIGTLPADIEDHSPPDDSDDSLLGLDSTGTLLGLALPCDSAPKGDAWPLAGVYEEPTESNGGYSAVSARDGSAVPLFPNGMGPCRSCGSAP